MFGARTVFEVRFIALFLASTILATSIPAVGAPEPSLEPELRQVVARYTSAIRTQNQAMLGAQMEAEIDGRLPKLEKQGRMKVLRMVSLLGDITFRQLGVFTGDDTVFKELIVRYLTEERQKKAVGAMNVSPAAYQFNIKAILTEHANTPQAKTVYVFDVKPHRNAPGLFRGEVWLDGATGMPLREAGQLVESPHFMLKKIRFTRDYQLVDGVSVLKHFESTADVRLFGPAELDIEFSNFTRNPAGQTVASAGF